MGFSERYGLWPPHRHRWLLNSHQIDSWDNKNNGGGFLYGISATLECSRCKRRRYVKQGIDDASCDGKFPSKGSCIIWLHSHLDTKAIPDSLPKELVD